MHSKRAAHHKAEFFLCLARAFAPPATGRTTLTAFQEHLGHDLTELANLCGYVIGQAADDYAREVSRIPDAQSLLVAYSRLFLVPGDRHPALNVGAYLDGAVAGRSVTAMAECYRQCGLETRPGLRELPDHVSVQLEFVAWLFAAQAEIGGSDVPMSAQEFIQRFVVHWVTAFRAEIEAATKQFRLTFNPYAPLARMLETAARTEAPVAEPGPRPEIDPDIARLRAEYAGHDLDDADLAFIRQRLKADGLVCDHVAAPAP